MKRLVLLSLCLLLLCSTASAKATITTPSITVNEDNLVANDIITVDSEGTDIIIQTSTTNTAGWNAAYASIVITDSSGNVVVNEEMLRSKTGDKTAKHMYNWNTSMYQSSDKYTFTVNYGGKSASTTRYLVNVRKWVTTEYVDREVITEVEHVVTETEYVDRIVTEYVNQTVEVEVPTINWKYTVCVGILGLVIGYFISKWKN